MMVAIEAVGATHRYPEQAKDVAFNPCGQVIGQRHAGAQVPRRRSSTSSRSTLEAVERVSETAQRRGLSPTGSTRAQAGPGRRIEPHDQRMATLALARIVAELTV